MAPVNAIFWASTINSVLILMILNNSHLASTEHFIIFELRPLFCDYYSF